MPRIGNRFDLLIVDEAHHFGANVRDEALEMCIAEQRLGLTATPPSEPALKRLSELIGPIVYQIGVGDLRGTWLADFDSVVLGVGLDAEERQAYSADLARFSEGNPRFRAFHPHRTWPELLSAPMQSPEGRCALD